jgi:tetratricopeptide (TPR) repeat protein
MPKKAKGFGQPQTPTRDAKRFMLAFRECAARAKGDQLQIRQFLQSKLNRLDESLLEALPQVFTALTTDQPADKRESIAHLFGTFGAALQEFPLGDRWLNLELSITAYRLVLKVFTREAFPEEWAGMQNNLGNAYSNRIRGDRAENLEHAIATYEQALQVRTREAFPEKWAMTQNNLGVAYSNRIRGDRAENLEHAIATYEQALQVRTREAFPIDWATTQDNLGNAYSDRIRGDRAENLEHAIATYEQALQVKTREAFPIDWAMTQNNLGVAYSDRIRGDRAENLEHAIATYGQALQVYTREAFPEHWAMIQTNLGNAYSDRIRGDRAENLEHAIAAYKQALQVYNRKAFPVDWAMTQNNLGLTYSDRIRGDRAENLEHAIAAYKQALQVRTHDAFPIDWAMTQGNQAEALMQRALLTENFGDLDTAISLLQAALEVAVPGSPDFIDSQYRLGNALSRCYDHSQNPSDLQQALAAYKIALDAISPEHYNRNQIWQAIPETQSILGSRLVREGKWQEGLQLLLNSVRQLSTGNDSLAHANALFQTGRAYETLADWDNARLYYRDALRLYAHLDNQLGVARSQTGLGSVLVSQGYLEKGMAELAKAKECYQQLQQSDKVADVDHLYQTIERALQRHVEVSA